MAGYRRIGDRRGRLRFEIVGQAWGTLDTAASPRPRDIGSEVDSPVPVSPRSADLARPRRGDHVSDIHVRVRPVRPRPRADPPTSLTALGFPDLSPTTLEQTGPVVDTARIRATVQLLDISMNGALLASPQHVGLGRRAALRTMLGGQPFAVEIQVQHVSPDVKSVHASSRFQLGVTFVSHDTHSLRCIQRFLNQKPV